MATLVVQRPPIRKSRSPSPAKANLTLDASRFAGPAAKNPTLSVKHADVPIPNKHIPYCSPGPAPATQVRLPVTPPASPPTKQAEAAASLAASQTVLHPPDDFGLLVDNPPVYGLDATTLAQALEELGSRPLPDASTVFPWLHGLHPENQVQQAFFLARRNSLRRTPACLRGITLVKVGGDLQQSKLRGAVGLDEILCTEAKTARTLGPEMRELDPKDGFSVRNFHIQTAKMALVSDIVLYKDDATTLDELRTAARNIAQAQRRVRHRATTLKVAAADFHTFMLITSFDEIQKHYPWLIALDANGQRMPTAIDFSHLERTQMCNMSAISELTQNVFVGPSPALDTLDAPATDQIDTTGFDILIEATDAAHAPNTKTLNQIAQKSASAPQCMEFPGSGSMLPPTWSHAEVDALLETCHWMHRLTHADATQEAEAEDDPQSPPQDSDGDIPMRALSKRSRKILLHCTDGYTETTLLALAYFMFAEALPVGEAYIRMHRERGRNFFAYPSDVALLRAIQPRILQESPRHAKLGAISLSRPPADPTWLKGLDGSLPSRVLPHLYLGNIAHANNADLLRAMGIGRVLSVGEPVAWPRRIRDSWGAEKILYIDRVQDNGVDGLLGEFERCSDFIGKGRDEESATLVHCRVGVSRSATVCIAEVMASLGLSFPQAYCFVRARRLNVIIQPHLRFVYELMQWDQIQQARRGQPVRRELEWPTIAREIAAMNKPYTR